MRLAAALFALFLAAGAWAQGPAPAWPAADWERATPEQVGMQSRALAMLVEYGGNAQMDSLVVTRHGRLVLEAYYAPFRRGMKHRINSATKGVVAALAGIAIAEGLLPGPDAEVADLLPEARGVEGAAGLRGVKVQHLLDMTSGLDWTEPLSDAAPTSLIELQRRGDWLHYVMERPLAQPPGAAFNYNSGNSHVLSALIARRSGRPTEQYATEKLFRPLGITDVRWRRDPQGLAIGGWGLYLRTPDMARIGHLYLHRGEWNGRQVVPREWVERVFRADVDMFPGLAWRYADQWWTLPRRQAYLAVGYNRQLIIVLPALGVVAAATGRGHYPIENVLDHLERAAASTSPLPEDAEGQQALRAMLDQVATERVEGANEGLPPLAAQVSGRTWVFAENALGLRSFTLHFGASPRYRVHTVRNGSGVEVELPLGLDGRYAFGEGPESAIGSKATWIRADTLLVQERQPEEGVSVRYELRFGEGVVELTHLAGRGPRRVMVGHPQ